MKNLRVLHLLEDDQEQQTSTFDTQEQAELRSQLSSEVQEILKSKNESIDSKNIGTWNSAYKACQSDDERIILNKLFFSKKMNINPDLIEECDQSILNWTAKYGYNPDKNTLLKFIDNYETKNKESKITVEMIYLFSKGATDKTITTYDLNDSRNIIYNPNLYADMTIQQTPERIDIINWWKLFAYKNLFKIIYNDKTHRANIYFKSGMEGNINAVQESESEILINLKNKFTELSNASAYDVANMFIFDSTGKLYPYEDIKYLMELLINDTSTETTQTTQQDSRRISDTKNTIVSRISRNQNLPDNIFKDLSQQDIKNIINSLNSLQGTSKKDLLNAVLTALTTQK